MADWDKWMAEKRATSDELTRKAMAASAAADRIRDEGRQRQQARLEASGYYQRVAESDNAAREYEKAGQHLLDKTLDKQTKKELKALQREASKRMTWTDRVLARMGINMAKRQG